MIGACWAKPGVPATDDWALLEELKTRKRTLYLELQEVESEIVLLEDRLSALDNRGSSQGELAIEIELRTSTTLHAEPNQFSEQVAHLRAGNTVRVVGAAVVGEWYPSVFEGQHGYVDYSDIAGVLDGQNALRLVEFSIQLAKRKQEAEEAAYQAERERELEAVKAAVQATRAKVAQRRREAINASFSGNTAKRLLNGEAWLGMTKEMLILSRGYPDHVSRTVSGAGVREQWFYPLLGVVYFFEEGVLTAWQDQALTK